MADLKPGDHGAEVRKAQMLLNSILQPSPALREDGDFGEKTREAVARLQQQSGLPATGIVGAETWKALGQAPTEAPMRDEHARSAPWMQIAESELGIHENALPGQNNARILEYHATTTLKATTDETAWCSSFVNWVLKKSGVSGTNSAAAMSWLSWGIELPVPRTGAVTVIKKKGSGNDAATGSTSGFHVAFYASSAPAYVRLLGGNQSDQVKYSTFSLNAYKVRGYRWPA